MKARSKMRHSGGGEAKLLALCGAVLLAGAGCATTGVAIGPAKAEEGEVKLDLLARGFLVRGQPASEGFGYYAYLVFLDAAESTRPQREAAVRAFARLLDDVTELSALDVPRERLAVLYCPVKERPEPSPEEILAAYDYAHARLLTLEIERRGQQLPRLFLLGSPSPIQPRSAALPADLRVVELKGDAQAIESAVLRFRSSLLTPGQPVLARALLERVYAFFESVGGFVLSVGQ